MILVWLQFILFNIWQNEGKLKLFWLIFIELDKLYENCFIKRILVNGVSMMYDWSTFMFRDKAFRRLLLILDTWSFKLKHLKRFIIKLNN